MFSILKGNKLRLCITSCLLTGELKNKAWHLEAFFLNLGFTLYRSNPFVPIAYIIESM